MDILVRVLFQSTLPLRGATRNSAGFWKHTNFNPRSPCGERLLTQCLLRFFAISIHAPLAGSDLGTAVVGVCDEQFQSTLPLRGATRTSRQGNRRRWKISIHAPLAGSDRPYTSSPRYSLSFQSTLPLRGATRSLRDRRRHHPISIHAPLAGSDQADQSLDQHTGISIHAPLAGSDLLSLFSDGFDAISIHAPLAGSDLRTSSALARPF